MLWKRRWEYCRRFYAPWHERIEKELRFALKMQHYLVDQGPTLDRRRIQYKGRELFAKIRRMVADVTAAPIFIEATPVETDGVSDDPITAEDAKFALEQDIRSPDKGFDTYVERMVLGAVSARAWGMAVDFEPDIQPFGEVLFRNVDPTRLYLCPPYQDLWDPRLPYVIEEVHMRVVEAKRMKGWKGARNLAPDSPPTDNTGIATSDETGRVRLWSQPGPEPEKQPEGLVVILKCWSRFDDEVKTSKGETNVLPPEMQYAGCTTCGWTSPTNAERNQMGLPDIGPDGLPCEGCLGKGQLSMAPLIGAERVDEQVLARRKGKRLEIVAPLQTLSLRDGDWPQDLRSYPYMMLTRYEHPRDVMGLSETTIDSPMQIINNALMQRAYDQVKSVGNILAVIGAPKTGTGDEFTPSDEPWQVAYFDDPGTNIQQFKADGVSPSLVQLVNLVQASFRADIGTAELGLSPQQSKDIPVGTVERIVESGSIPTDHLIRRLRRGMAPFLGVISDMQRETWTDERWIKYAGPDGLVRAKRLRGAAIPNADFVIKTDPQNKVMDKQQTDAIIAWYQMPPALRDEMAARFGIDPSTVQRIKQKEQELKSQADAMAASVPGGMGGPMPPPAGGPMVPGAPPLPMAQG